MSVVPSPGSEPFVLARRGLPLAGRARPALPARWFVSFAFARSRLPPSLGAPAMPRVEPQGETEQDLDEDRLVARGRWPDVGAALARLPVPGQHNAADAGAGATMPKQEAHAGESPADVGFRTHAGVAVPFQERDAPQRDIRAQRPGIAAAARPAEGAWNDRPTATASARAPLGAAQTAGPARQAIPRPSLDQALGEAPPAAAYDDAAGTQRRAPLGVTPSMEASPGVGLDDAARNSLPLRLPVPEAGAVQAAATPTASGNMPAPREPAAHSATHTQRSASPTPAQSKTGAPARVATPMGAARRGDPDAAASPAEIAQLVERSRAGPPVNAGGRLTHRIGTVQVVVQSSAPAARAAPEAPRASGPGDASTAREPVRRGFRNPWASYARRRD